MAAKLIQPPAIYAGADDRCDVNQSCGQTQKKRSLYIVCFFQKKIKKGLRLLSFFGKLFRRAIFPLSTRLRSVSSGRQTIVYVSFGFHQDSDAAART